MQKRLAMDMSRMTRELEDLDREIHGLEFELENSGSTKTSDEVEAQLEALGITLFVFRIWHQFKSVFLEGTIFNFEICHICVNTLVWTAPRRGEQRPL